MRICPVIRILRVTFHRESGLQIFFQDRWAEVTLGTKNGGSFSEMIGPSISN